MKQPPAEAADSRSPRAWMAWSSGKDSLWALHLARRAGHLDIVGLLTSITETYDRVTMHGVRESLLQAQAAALGLPLHRILIPTPCSQQQYEDIMRATLERARSLAVTKVVFGDISLADVRAHRERQMARVDMEALFPLWGMDTGDLARQIIAGGVRATITCLDPTKVPAELAGREFDDDFLTHLPDTADPCGENGEFHTFAWHGPDYPSPIPITVGQTLNREGFLFTDLHPA